MTKTIDMKALTGGTMDGKITVTAWGWDTRHSWGHEAEVTIDIQGRPTRFGHSRVRYYNRTWECYRFQSVLHAALCDFVKTITGRDPYKAINTRDQKPMKSAAAEERRLERVTFAEGVKELYRRLKAVVDGETVAETYKNSDIEGIINGVRAA